MKTSITSAERDAIVALALKTNVLIRQAATVEDEIFALLDGADNGDLIDHVSDCVRLIDPAGRVDYMLAVLGIEVKS